MSAYRVFGISYDQCLKKARSITPDRVNKMELTLVEWEAACRKKATKLFERSKPTGVSGKLDAPQFCQDFIDLCDRSKFKDLTIRCYSPVKGKLIATGKKKGLQRFSWQPYKKGLSA